MIAGAKDQALFLYGFDITSINQFIDFQAVSMGPVLTATLNTGNYTGTQFAAEIKRALEAADGANTYTVTIDRTVDAGTENRMHISTSGSFLSLLFGSGTHSGSMPNGIMGYTNVDRTGSTTYSGTFSAGTILIPAFPTWNYLGPDEMVEQDGTKNVSSTGIKETLVFAQMTFFQGEWRYITDVDFSNQKTNWEAMLKYLTRQLKFEFTPSISEDPTLFYQATLETTTADSNGMKYRLDQMVSVGLYRYYQTGIMKFRVLVT